MFGKSSFSYMAYPGIFTSFLSLSPPPSLQLLLLLPLPLSILSPHPLTLQGRLDFLVCFLTLSFIPSLRVLYRLDIWPVLYEVFDTFPLMFCSKTGRSSKLLDQKKERSLWSPVSHESTGSVDRCA